MRQVYRIIAGALEGVLRIEHIIYCMTDTRVELPFHAEYYRRANERYMRYVEGRFRRTWLTYE